MQQQNILELNFDLLFYKFRIDPSYLNLRTPNDLVESAFAIEYDTETSPKTSIEHFDAEVEILDPITVREL